MTREEMEAVPPISDDRLEELDRWYRQCPSVSLTFCDQDYFEMRARMRGMVSELERLQAELAKRGVEG
jgi:hypothetical protein